MDKNHTFILGAGITGLTVGYHSCFPIIEAKDYPGGICSSYYLRTKDKKRLRKPSSDGKAYRFENGGGHWIFGADKKILQFIRKFTSLKSYKRRSAVYFNKKKFYVPYPLQNNLRFFKKEIINKILKELSSKSLGLSTTKEKWLLDNFGTILCKLFFFPFHSLYTANLYKRIAPQDTFKSPIDISLVIQGASHEIISGGYNTDFVYPVEGLNTLVDRISNHCNILYNKRLVKIDVKSKNIYFSDGSTKSYERLISTLSLNKMMQMADLAIDERPDPYTSVLVLNIGAVRGKRCPDEHWLYIPDSKSGFYRVGFYSNVDNSFIPKAFRKTNNRVAIYVERAYRDGHKPSGQELKAYSRSVIKELKHWAFVENIEIIDSTWIDVAYTWSWPNSKWKEHALEILKKHNIHQLGRYGGWKFQGIADSIREGLAFSSSLGKYE
ncbi:MAG: FAD-dependent oxidoreductase [Omnitrophica bacterium]|nr:FAD-dependent oxidoreductase [Candidatus Omnitrophota bacterium]